MTSSVSGLVAYPVIAMLAVVVILRAVLLESNLLARRVTSALMFALASTCLRQSEVQVALSELTRGHVSVELTRQVSTVLFMMVTVPMLQVVVPWLKVGDGVASRSSRALYPGALMSGVAMIVLGGHARALRQYIEVTPGWQTVVYTAIFGFWACAMAFALLTVCVTELRLGRMAVRHTAAYVVLAIFAVLVACEGLSIAAHGALAAADTAHHAVHMRIRASENNGVYMVALGAVCGSLPLITAVAQRVGIDRWSRAKAQLEPMWLDLVRVCPEVRFDSGSWTRDEVSKRRLVHRMMIETRDALSVLNRFRPDDADVAIVGDDTLARAVSYQAAGARKEAGCPPTAHGRVLAPAGRDIGDELTTLCRFAAQWQAAKDSMHRTMGSGQ